MSGFDVGGVYTAEILAPNDVGNLPEHAELSGKFLKFLREFRLGEFFVYRDQLLQNLQVRQHVVEIELDHLTAFDETLTNHITNRPTDVLPIFEDAAKVYVQTLSNAVKKPNEDPDNISDWQVVLRSNANATPIRSLTAEHISKLVRIPAIVISASTTQAKATMLHIMCRNCRDTRFIPLKAGITGASLPRSCGRVRVEAQQAGEQCPIDPYLIVPDGSQFVDQQTLKLQEPPDMVPVGELPRHMLATCDRSLANRAVPGTRVTAVAVYSIFQSKQTGPAPAVRSSYLRIVGLEIDSEGSGRTLKRVFTSAEETELIALSHQPDIYARFANSIAPSIFGSADIKKSIACLLFSGSRKLLPDGMRLRGDINVLLLGDPGTAKSQLLKFVEKMAPIGVYTSGKGSSAAGLTASVVRDPASREFYLEGGAMVLADGGVVCIDEFDKMREEDRVAIHEAMEQQTISIAKAGITTILNSRTAVLAAANPVFGRYDDLKSPGENIDFQSTILSRFDMIFIVKDEHDPHTDMRLAKHVVSVHRNVAGDGAVADIDIKQMKNYVSYCRMKCAPRLSEEAAEKLVNYFVSIRNDVREKEAEADQRSSIPVTVRQLEAIVRITEALAKMTLSAYATERHVDEAIRLFTVSTMNAVNSGQMMEGVVRGDMLKEVETVERDIRRRLPVGSRIQHRVLVDELKRKDYTDTAIAKAIQIMLRRDQLRQTNQARTLERVV